MKLMNLSKKNNRIEQLNDFNIFMGLNKDVWKFIQTDEDYKNLHHFKALYDKNKNLLCQKQKEIKVPKVLHFIWLGPKPFPKESIENVYSWAKLHPDWTIKFWTDRYRALPHPSMQRHLVSDFNFTHLEKHYKESDNYGEKCDILRYEILNQEGGLYVDHDVKCFKPFDSFHSHYDFYCALEPPHQPISRSSISVCNNIIGVRPGHPVMEAVINQVKDRWEEIAAAYPGNDKESVIYRVEQRTFIAFDNAVKEAADQDLNNDMVFPAAYFNQIEGDFALFAHHYYGSTWFEDESKFERNVRRRLVTISRKNNQILLLNAVILSINLMICIYLVILQFLV